MADDVLGERIAAADPLRDGTSGPGLDGALDALQEGIIAMALISPASRRRRRAVAALGAGLVFSAGVGAAAATDNLPVFQPAPEQGGWTVVEGEAQEGGEAGWEVVEGTPLPPGDGQDGSGGSDGSDGWVVEVPESAPQDAAPSFVACPWVAYWFDAQAAGDTAAVAEAEAAFDIILDMPAVAHGEPDTAATYEELAADVRGGRTDEVRDGWYADSCPAGEDVAAPE